MRQHLHSRRRPTGEEEAFGAFRRSSWPLWQRRWMQNQRTTASSAPTYSVGPFWRRERWRRTTRRRIRTASRKGPETNL